MGYITKAKRAAYGKAQYRDHGDVARTRTKRSNKRIRNYNTTYVEEYAMKAQCYMCPPGTFWPPSVLEFDHRDPKQKLFAISEHRKLRVSFAKLKIEIAKCDVICANHHRMRHDAERVFNMLPQKQSELVCEAVEPDLSQHPLFGWAGLVLAEQPAGNAD